MVGGEDVDGHDRGDAEAPHDLQVLEQVGGAVAHVADVLLEHLLGQILAADESVASAVGLERPDGDHDDGDARVHPGDGALEVHEALQAHVGSEAGLGEDVAAVAGSCRGDAVGDDRGASGGDVAEGAGVDQDGGALAGAQEIGLEGVAQDGTHGPGRLEVLGADPLAAAASADDDAPQARAQVGQVRGQRHDDHELTGRGDVEGGLPGDSIDLGPQAGDDMAQGAVVDVQHPGPGDGALVNVELIAVVQVVVDHRRQEVVGGGDGVEVAGQVQVHPLCRQDAGATGSSGSALDAEGGAHGRLAQSQDCLLAQAGEPLGQSDGRGGLALPERRRRDRSDDDVVRATRTTAAHVLAGFQCPQVDLGHITAIGNDVLGSYSR